MAVNVMDNLLERARTDGTPLIDGDEATFVWEGETAPELIGDFNEWGHGLSGATWLEPVASGVWAATVTLPSDAYIEYIFTTDPDDPKARVLDPLNSRQITNGMGKFNNHFLMPEARHTTMDEFRSGTPQGNVTRHTLFHDYFLIGNRRDVWLYQPPSTDPAPLLVIFDGRDYLRRANITQIIANLMADGTIPPLALAMIDNAKGDRFVEYNTSESQLAAITEVLIPMAQRQLYLVDIEKNPGAYGVLGASMGGNMALYAGLRLPHIFGKVISQAGAFQFSVIDEAPLLKEFVQHMPKRDLKIWQDVGALDWLVDENREMNKLLTDKGYDVTYREYSAGHNYTAWHNTLPDAIVALFGKGA